MEIKNKKIILRSPTKGDIEDLVEGLNNLNVSRTFGVVSYPYTKENASKWIDKDFKEIEKEKRENYRFAIELKSESKLVGEIGINHIDYFNRGASMSYWLNEKYWNQGIAPEAMNLAIDFAFNKLKLRRLYLFVYDSNTNSNGLAKKLGFKLEGTLRKSHKSKATGEIFNSNCYGLLDSD